MRPFLPQVLGDCGTAHDALKPLDRGQAHVRAAPFQLGRDMNQLGIPNISASAITENPNFW